MHYTVNNRPLGAGYDAEGGPKSLVELKTLNVSSIQPAASSLVISGDVTINGDISADNLVGGSTIGPLLASISALEPVAPNTVIVFTGTNIAATATITDYALQVLESTTAADARTKLELGSIAIEDTPLSVTSGGTGQNSFTANHFLVGNGGGPLNSVATGTFFTTGTTLDNLADVNVPNPGDGDVLYWNGSEWKSAQPHFIISINSDSLQLGDLNNVQRSTTVSSDASFSLEDGSPLTWNNTSGVWQGDPLSSWVTGHVAPNLSANFVSAGGGTYANSNYIVSSLSAVNLSSTNLSSINISAINISATNQKVISLSATTISATTYVNLDATLQAIANQSTGSNVLIYFSGVDLTASTSFTTAGRKFCAVTSTLATGDLFYYNGTNIVNLGQPSNPAVLLNDPINGTGLPYWEEAPTSTPDTSYVLQVDIDSGNLPSQIYWGVK